MFPLKKQFVRTPKPMRANRKTFHFTKQATCIFSLSGLIGIFPFRLIREHTSLSIPLAMVSIISNCYLVWLTTEYTISMLGIKSLSGSVPLGREKFVLISVSLGKTCFFIYTTLTSFSRAKYLDVISNELDDVDSLMEKVCTVCRKKTFKTRYYIGGVLLTLHLFYRTTSTITHEILTYICLWLVASQFSVLAELICLRLRVLGDCMGQIYLMGDFRQRCGVVAVLSEIHSKLCDVYSVLQDSYKRILTLQVTACFVQLIISLFYLYAIIINNHEFEISSIIPLRSETGPMNRIIEFSFTIFTIWEITTDAIEISDEVENFNLLLYRLMIHDKTKILLENKRLTSHITVKRKVAFSACGFFNFDYTLLHSILAAVATYFVVLIS